ncbi:FtsX-like permease family protein [Gemmiger sp.]
MKNPLNKRCLRELRSEAGKYIVIAVLLVATIGLVSGFLVAASSMITAYNEGFAKYNIEDGHFRVENELNRAQRKVLSADVTLYDLPYREAAIDNGSTLRVYADRTQVNTVCLMQGALPAAADEIAIDRMYADNNGLTVGDTLSAGDEHWTVTGLVALPDYSCLFSDNTDTMFDAIKFGVAIVTQDGFAAMREPQVWNYAWKYNTAPADDAAERDAAEAYMKLVNKTASLQDFVPVYENQAITFTGEDFGSDQAMITVLLYIIIAIMPFVFAVTTANTIAKEAGVIGTLRASGYSRGELVRHYMTMPVLITLISAAVGNVIGYTVAKDFCAGIYYGSYSLPTYVTRWNADAFWKTTLVPVALMIFINWIVLSRTLKLSPLQFLRRDLSRHSKRKHALPLPKALPFFTRFRLRVILQNLGSYAVLFVGVLFANLLLSFGLMLPDALNHYSETVADNMLANTQTMLQIPYSAMDEDRKLNALVSMMLFRMETETEKNNAEKFSAYSLQTLGREEGGITDPESILLYGVEPDSRYVALPGDGVYISAAYADKYELGAGDTITLKEKYEDTTYSFTVDGVYDYAGALAVFMPREKLNDVFDLGSGYYGGYFSDAPLTEIDEKYIGSVIDLDALTKVSRQLMVSMGSSMGIVNVFAVMIFVVVVYLLSKMIIEKNAQSISMAKILGYSGPEVARLYLLSTTVVVVLCLAVSLPIEVLLMRYLFRAIIVESMTGWIALWVSPTLYPRMMAIGLGCYAAVALLEYRRICRVPMDEALKNVE